MDQNSIELVFGNCYLLEQIMKHLDVRSLSQCCSVCTDFHLTAKYEYKKRIDVKHVFVEVFERSNRSIGSDIEILFESFIRYIRKDLDFRPKHILLLVTCFRLSSHFDISKQFRKLVKMKNCLPNDCHISCISFEQRIESGCFALPVNGISHCLKFPKTSNLISSWARMSSLMNSDIDGIDIRTYSKIRDVKTNGVKAVLMFSSTKFNRHLENFRIFQKQNFSFVGGIIRGITINRKVDQKGYNTSNKLLVTFGGSRVRSASTLLYFEANNSLLTQLIQFKRNIGFDCDDFQSSLTIAFIFVQRFGLLLEEFQKVFPFVVVNGCRTNRKIFGNKYRSTQLKTIHFEKIDPSYGCAILLVNLNWK